MALFLLLAASFAFWASRQLHRIEPLVGARVVAALAARFHARVQLDEFHLQFLRGVEAEGRGLRIWQNDGGQPAQPLITLDHFSFHTGLHLSELAWILARNRGTLRIPAITIDGARIHLPPHSHFALKPQTQSDGNTTPPALDFLIDNIQCKNLALVFETDQPGKVPLDFEINTLELDHSAPGQPMRFTARLHIPRPDGEVITNGNFGPWTGGDLGNAPLSGVYTLHDAQLAVFKGIAGALNSNGIYEGTLRQLTVSGHTATPDFHLTHFGNPMPLKTQFKAQVDATDGDTHLDDVAATLGRSQFKVRGDIQRITTDGTAHGHQIQLTTASLGAGHVEDFLALTGSRPRTLMNGDLIFTAAFHLPPGSIPLHRRMSITGKFQLRDALFTNPDVQSKIREISLRGQGRPNDIASTNPNSILSTMYGDFSIRDGVLKLPNLNYQVPGAQMNFMGTYLLDGGGIQFSGSAKLDARLSQMTTGWKSSLLKTFEGAVSRDGAGTYVPIKIDGTWKKPHFAIDFSRLLRP